MSRRPGYGLEYDIEKILRDRFDITISGEDMEGDAFTDLEFEETTDELIEVLRDKGYLKADAA